MNWISLGVCFAAIGLGVYGWLHERRLRKQQVLFILNNMKDIFKLIETQGRVNNNQQTLNNAIAHNLEILAVHSGLLKPSIDFEASQFLAWENLKKEEDNG